MRAADLRTADQLYKRQGVRMLVYGKAGSGKTPMIQSAPRPVLLATEVGTTSLRGSNVPICEARTADAVDEFFKWFFESNESKSFDTVCIDSYTRLMELFLERALVKTRGAKIPAYGILETDGNILNYKLFNMVDKHAYLIAQLGKLGEEDPSMAPAFPGKALNRSIPHLFDQLGYISKIVVGGVPEGVSALRFRETPAVQARDRSMRLDELEYPNDAQGNPCAVGFPNLSRIFAKVMS